MITQQASVQSRYLDYLPAIFHPQAGETDQAAKPDDFLNGLLLAIEQILGGDTAASVPPGVADGDPAALSIEALINLVPTLVAPLPSYEAGRETPATPADFLPWLAAWVALDLGDGWSEATRRYLIGRVVPLYRRRGTCAGLAKTLETYASGLLLEPAPALQRPRSGALVRATVRDFARPLELGAISTLGVDAMVGSGPANYFVAQVDLRHPNPQRYATLWRTINAVIDAHRPAQSYYDAYLTVPTFTLGTASRSKLGETTFLCHTPIRIYAPDDALEEEGALQ